MKIQTRIEDKLVSTVLLSLAMGLPYETMVFEVVNGEIDYSGSSQFNPRHYKTQAQAKLGHEEVCNEVRKAIGEKL